MSANLVVPYRPAITKISRLLRYPLMRTPPAVGMGQARLAPLIPTVNAMMRMIYRRGIMPRRDMGLILTGLP
jgi:hypothetical protein